MRATPLLGAVALAAACVLALGGNAAALTRARTATTLHGAATIKGSGANATNATGAVFTTAPAASLTEVSGWVRTADGGGHGLSPVSFWPKADGWSTANGAVTVRSERSSRYTIHLPDGAWLGAACDSPTGYAPLFWEVVIADHEVVAYRERDDRQPEISRATIDASGRGGTPAAGDPVRVDGSGFGCSGHVTLFQSGQEVGRVVAFTLRSDGRLEFDLPPGGWDPQLPLAVAYTHGRWRSDLVVATPPAAAKGRTWRPTWR